MTQAHRSPAQWLRISCQAHAEALEAVSELLRRYVPSGISIEEAISPNHDQQGWAEGWEIDLSRPATVSAFIPLDERAAAISVEIEKGLWHLGQIMPVHSFSTEAVSEDDWANAWREHFHVHRVGRRLVIKPTWREYSPSPGEVIIELDPGMAFGTGLHPTTQLCLRELEERVQTGSTVADIGTGSGILAIAAARLGAARVAACDLDAVAVTAARQNVLINRLGDVIEVTQGTLSQTESALPPGPQFTLVVANIVADVISALMPHLFDATARGGVAIFSGIIEGKEGLVQQALRSVGFETLSRQQESDWVLLSVRRPDV